MLQAHDGARTTGRSATACHPRCAGGCAMRRLARPAVSRRHLHTQRRPLCAQRQQLMCPVRQQWPPCMHLCVPCPTANTLQRPPSVRARIRNNNQAMGTRAAGLVCDARFTPVPRNGMVVCASCGSNCPPPVTAPPPPAPPPGGDCGGLRQPPCADVGCSYVPPSGGRSGPNGGAVCVECGNNGRTICSGAPHAAGIESLDARLQI